MENRFLFRGKQAHGCDFVVGLLVGEKLIETEGKYIYHVMKETIGQCTGLKDKNGKLIFEGDKVKVWNGNKTYIYFDKGFWRIGKSGRLVLEGEFGELEIIGNIHEEE